MLSKQLATVGSPVATASRVPLAARDAQAESLPDISGVTPACAAWSFVSARLRSAREIFVAALDHDCRPSRTRRSSWLKELIQPAIAEGGVPNAAISKIRFTYAKWPRVRKLLAEAAELPADERQELVDELARMLPESDPGDELDVDRLRGAGSADGIRTRRLRRPYRLIGWEDARKQLRDG